jgi:peptidoglycan/xylan/chitin deacetylase (PgdA/CDA1 family)
VLDELAKRDLKAIFFWVSRRVTKKSPHLARRRALVERAVREGHIVANHGVNHLHLCSIPKRRAQKELDESAEVYRELTGLPIVFFRTPYGDHCKRLLRMLDERGLRHLHWDIDPMEWTDNDFRRVAGTLRRKMRRLDGRAVMLMHDTRFATAKALPLALEWLDAENQRRRERGKRPIRILTGSDLAFESLDPALVGWVREHGSAARDRLGSALASLVP